MAPALAAQPPQMECSQAVQPLLRPRFPIRFVPHGIPCGQASGVHCDRSYKPSLAGSLGSWVVSRKFEERAAASGPIGSIAVLPSGTLRWPDIVAKMKRELDVE